MCHLGWTDVLRGEGARVCEWPLGRHARDPIAARLGAAACAADAAIGRCHNLRGYIQATRPSLSHSFTPPPQATKTRRAVMDAERRKLKNRIAHSKPGSVVVKPARRRKIVEELE